MSVEVWKVGEGCMFAYTKEYTQRGGPDGSHTAYCVNEYHDNLDTAYNPP